MRNDRDRTDHFSVHKEIHGGIVRKTCNENSDLINTQERRLHLPAPKLHDTCRGTKRCSAPVLGISTESEFDESSTVSVKIHPTPAGCLIRELIAIAPPARSRCTFGYRHYTALVRICGGTRAQRDAHAQDNNGLPQRCEQSVA